MRKYDTITTAYTVMADGMCSHDGFFSFIFGHSSTANGILYKVSMNNREETFYQYSAAADAGGDPSEQRLR